VSLAGLDDNVSRAHHAHPDLVGIVSVLQFLPFRLEEDGGTRLDDLGGKTPGQFLFLEPLGRRIWLSGSDVVLGVGVVAAWVLATDVAEPPG